MDHTHHHGHHESAPTKQQAHEHQKHGPPHQSHHAHASSESSEPSGEHQIHEQGDGAGHHHAMMVDDFKKRFWISLALTVPILLLSEMIQHWLGFRIHFPGDKYLLLALSSLLFFYCGWPFLKGFVRELQARSPGMMSLIGLAISVAYIFSMAVIFGFPGMDFFWEVATLIAIMLLGHWLEMKSVLGASKALQLLVRMMPAEAHKLHGDHVVDVKLEELQEEDVVLIRPGEKVPADGMVVEGESYLDESMLTGESRPVRKERNDKVIGGSVNGNGSLKVRVQHTGKDSYLNKVIRLVEEAQRSKSRTQHLANRAAKWLTYMALLVGIGTLVFWLVIGSETNFAVERMVTVMVISCPHALGLAIPLVVAISTAVSAQNGLLIRNRTAFENSRRINAMVFDKTGTLTKGEFGVSRVVPLMNISEADLLQYAAALERESEHPIAVGITREAARLKISSPPASGFKAIPGKGVEAIVKDRKVQVVSPGYLRELQLSIPGETTGNAAETIVYVIFDGQLAGFIALADALRPESKAAVAAFRKNGIRVYMATGDNRQVAESVAKELELDGFYAEVLPHQKVEIVKELQQKGAFIAMTGDGVNDAPALAQADVGIAVGSGTDVAAETADIILVNSNPADILKLILFGRATYRKMLQNLAWATGYNAIAIPLAAGVLHAAGFVLDPAIGAVLMSLSTIIVAVNAQLLRGSIRRAAKWMHR